MKNRQEKRFHSKKDWIGCKKKKANQNKNSALDLQLNKNKRKSMVSSPAIGFISQEKSEDINQKTSDINDYSLAKKIVAFKKVEPDGNDISEVNVSSSDIDSTVGIQNHQDAEVPVKPIKKRQYKVSTKDKILNNPLYLVPFKNGWKRELVCRASSSKRKGDIYYYTPEGVKLRSRNEVKKHSKHNLFLKIICSIITKLMIYLYGYFF